MTYTWHMTEFICQVYTKFMPGIYQVVIYELHTKYMPSTCGGLQGCDGLCCHWDTFNLTHDLFHDA